MGIIALAALVGLGSGLGVGLFLRQVVLGQRDGLRAELRRLEAELVDRRAQVTSLSQAREAQTLELAQALATRAEAQRQTATAQAGLAGVERERSGLLAREAALAQTLETTRRQATEMAEALAHAQAREAQLEEEAAQLGPLRERLLDATRQHARLENELEARDARVVEQAELLRQGTLRLAALETRWQSTETERAELSAALAAERRAATERAALEVEGRQQVELKLESVARRLLEDKGQTMLAEHRLSLEQLLGPLKERLHEFEAKVDRTWAQDTKDRASLLHRLRELQEAQSRLHEDAQGLTRALTGESKAQGDGGEMVLERLLETAGLTEGREFETQSSHTDDAGNRLRPDVVVYLPHNRAIVIDAKCSLTAFVASSRAVDEIERRTDLVAHVHSVRTHVRELARKRYQDLLRERTLDIVLMFVPNEAAFHAALAGDGALYDEAFRQGVVLASPTTLLAALQLVGHVWRSEKQHHHAQLIADEAGKMIEKLLGATEAIDEVGDRLDRAQLAWRDARKRLFDGRGSLVDRAQKVVELGARLPREKADALGRLQREPADAPLPLEAPAPARVESAQLSLQDVAP
jgi:DNA recombination protein RmuC